METTMNEESLGAAEFAKLSAVQKLAALLLILNAENAAHILSSLGEEELEAVSKEMANFTAISQELQAEIMREFSPVALEAATAVGGGIGRTRLLLEQSVGRFRASDILCRVSPSRTQVSAMQEIVEMDPQHLFNLLRHEQLQTIALVASFMSPIKASQLLSLLRPELREQVVERLATLAPTSIEAVEDVAGMLQKKLANIRTRAMSRTGGLKVAAEVLNALPRNISEAILVSLKERNAELGEAVLKKMFTFDEMQRLDSKTLQKVMQEVDMRTLSIALKTASESLKAALLACISKRAAESVREEMSFLGPLKVSQIETAQNEIIATVRRLESEGTIDLGELRESSPTL
jgi:flagellar motor switch protein FliG